MRNSSLLKLISLFILTLLACTLSQAPLPTLIPSQTIPPSQTVQPSPSLTLSPSPTVTPTPSLTPTQTFTPTQTPSQTPSPTPSLTPITLDREKLGTAAYNVTYCLADNKSLLMDMYYPDEGDGPLPVAVYIHGGSWKSGDKAANYGFRFINHLRRHGYLVVSINYRLSPEYRFPAHIQDAKCAIRHLRANAGEYSLNPERIGVIGSSAGGHLAALLGTSAGSSALEGQGGYLNYSSSVQAVVDLYGPINTDFFCTPYVLQDVFGTADCQAAILTSASPLTYITPNDPPFLILHGDEDDLVSLSQSQILHGLLTSAGVPSELIIVENEGHGFEFENYRSNPSLEDLLESILAFFDSHLK